MLCMHPATLYCSIEACLLVLAAALPVGRLDHKFHRENVSQLGTIAIPSTCDLQQTSMLSAVSRDTCFRRMLRSAQACPRVEMEDAAPGRAICCTNSNLLGSSRCIQHGFWLRHVQAASGVSKVASRQFSPSPLHRCSWSWSAGAQR